MRLHIAARSSQNRSTACRRCDLSLPQLSAGTAVHAHRRAQPRHTHLSPALGAADQRTLRRARATRCGERAAVHREGLGFGHARGDRADRCRARNWSGKQKRVLGIETELSTIKT